MRLWPIRRAAAAAATRWQPDAAPRAPRGDPERRVAPRVRSKARNARPPCPAHWRKEQQKPRMPVRAADSPASFRIAPARRDRAQAVCRSNSPPIPYLNATIAATTASKLATAPDAVEGINNPGVPVCDRVPNRNRPTEPRTLSGNMAKGRNRRQRRRGPTPHAQPTMEWI